MKFEYKLVKWLDEGGNKELPVTIQEEAIEDFCELMDWDKEEFYGNTIRYPLGEEEEDGKEEAEPESKPVKKRTRRIKIVTPNKKEPQKKYPDEMRGFVERHLNQNNNQEICDLINEKWDVEITKERLAAYMAYNKLKRDKNKKLHPQLKRFEAEEKNKYNGDGVFHLDHNGKYACTPRIDSNKNKLSKDWNVINCGNCKNRFEGETKTPIEEFVANSKITDPLLLRDAIIEKFEKNISVPEIKKMINNREDNSPKESLKEEVKRITKKRPDDDLDEDVDGMELNY